MAGYLKEALSADTEDKTIPGSVGFKVLQSLSEKHRYANILFSPLNLQLSFALLYRCSCSHTSTELKTAFDLLRGRPQDIADSHNQVLSEAADPDLFAEGLLLIDSQVMLSVDFLKTCKEFNKLQVRLMNFKQTAAVYKTITNLLNKRWAKVTSSSGTRSLPSSEMDDCASLEGVKVEFTAPLQTETIIVINTAHFRAKIEAEIFESDGMRVFHKCDDEQFEIEFMHGCSVMQIYKSRVLKADVIEIPLRNKNNFFLYVILPFTVNGIWHTEVALYDLNFTGQLAHLRPFLVDIAMPRFSLNCLVRLKEVLQLQGIVRIFNKNESQFPGISSSSVSVDGIYQRCAFEFVTVKGNTKPDRNATLSDSSHTSYKDKHNRDLLLTKETFVVDHPFLFIIRKNDTTNERVKNIFVGKFASAPRS